MTRQLRYFEKAAFAAGFIGFWLWAVAAIGFTLTGSPVLWMAAYALIGAAFVAGVWGVGARSIRAVLQTRRHMAVARRALSAVRLPPLDEDESEIVTRAAMKRAADSYQRRLEPSFLQQRGAI